MNDHASQILEIPDAIGRQMRGVSWHEDIPSPRLHELRLLRLPFVDFQGQEQVGSLITSAELAESVVEIFAGLRAIEFPIHSIRPMIDFAGDDGLSMAANNSSCFNSRYIINSDRLSAHAQGAAIDINPVQNPVIRDGKYRPAEGKHYLDRGEIRPGMFVAGSAALAVVTSAGWKWGGDWDNPKDYHHFYWPGYA